MVTRVRTAGQEAAFQQAALRNALEEAVEEAETAQIATANINREAAERVQQQTAYLRNVSQSTTPTQRDVAQARQYIQEAIGVDVTSPLTIEQQTGPLSAVPPLTDAPQVVRRGSSADVIRLPTPTPRRISTVILTDSRPATPVDTGTQTGTQTSTSNPPLVPLVGLEGLNRPISAQPALRGLSATFGVGPRPPSVPISRISSSNAERTLSSTQNVQNLIEFKEPQTYPEPTTIYPTRYGPGTVPDYYVTPVKLTRRRRRRSPVCCSNRRYQRKPSYRKKIATRKRCRDALGRFIRC